MIFNKTQMSKIFSIIGAGVFLLSVVNIANADVFAEWDKRPIRVMLNLGKERIVTFNKDVAVALPSSLNGRMKVQSVGGSLYMTPSQLFDETRLQVKEVATGKIILLDVVATDQGEDYEYEPMVITTRADREQQEAELKARVKAETLQAIQEKKEKVEKPVAMPFADTPKTATQLPTPASLIRYAAQSLYAPARTIEPLPGVTRVAVKLPRLIPRLIPNLPLEIKPLESWGLGDYVVTAFRLKNTTDDDWQLAPQYLQGDYYAVAFQHPYVGRKGTLEDTTVVYVVTQGKFTTEMMY